MINSIGEIKMEEPRIIQYLTKRTIHIKLTSDGLMIEKEWKGLGYLRKRRTNAPDSGKQSRTNDLSTIIKN